MKYLQKKYWNNLIKIIIFNDEQYYRLLLMYDLNISSLFNFIKDYKRKKKTKKVLRFLGYAS